MANGLISQTIKSSFKEVPQMERRRTLQFHPKYKIVDSEKTTSMFVKCSTYIMRLYMDSKKKVVQDFQI